MTTAALTPAIVSHAALLPLAHTEQCKLEVEVFDFNAGMKYDATKAKYRETHHANTS